MRRVIIVGYMGAGKTTVGRALAKDTGMQFYDLDWYIEARMRKTVPQLFAERGEEGFRLVERNMLHEAAEFEDVVLSCGGGTKKVYVGVPGEFLNVVSKRQLVLMRNEIKMPSFISVSAYRLKRQYTHFCRTSSEYQHPPPYSALLF